MAVTARVVTAAAADLVVQEEKEEKTAMMTIAPRMVQTAIREAVEMVDMYT